MNRWSRHRRPVLGLLGMLVAVAAWATPAGAHGGPATFEVVSSDQVGANTWKYVVSLTFDEDGHGLAEAPTVVAEVRATSVGPIVMTPTDVEGRYMVDLTLPTDGDWTVRFTSVEPVASLSVNQFVSVLDVAETSRASTTTEVASSTTSGSSTPDIGDATEGTDTRSDAPLLTAVGVVTLTALAGLVALRRRGASSETPPSGDA